MSGRELRRFLALLRPVCVPRDLVDALATMAAAASLQVRLNSLYIYHRHSSVDTSFSFPFPHTSTVHSFAQAVNSVEFGGSQPPPALQAVLSSAAWPPQGGWSAAFWICIGPSTVSVRCSGLSVTAPLVAVVPLASCSSYDLAALAILGQYGHCVAALYLCRERPDGAGSGGIWGIPQGALRGYHPNQGPAWDTGSNHDYATAMRRPQRGHGVYDHPQCGGRIGMDTQRKEERERQRGDSLGMEKRCA